MSGRTRLPEICAKSLRGFSSVSAKSRWGFPNGLAPIATAFWPAVNDKLYVILRIRRCTEQKNPMWLRSHTRPIRGRGVPTRLQDGDGGDRLEAPGIALSFWQVAGLVKVQEPGGGGREARGGRGLGHVPASPAGNTSEGVWAIHPRMRPSILSSARCVEVGSIAGT